MPKWLNLKKKNYFCKKYGSHERRLLNFSYLCTRGGRTAAVVT